MTAPRVLVTRPEGQADALIGALRAGGIEPVHIPTVTILPEDDPALDAAMADALTEVGRIDWLVITSANGAGAVAASLVRIGLTLPASVRVAAVGPATAEALRAAGIGVDAVPTEYRTRAIVDALGAVEGRRVMLARADAASPELRQALEERGAGVREVVAYRTGDPPPASASRLREALESGLVAATFTSPSTVRGFVGLLDTEQAEIGMRLRAFCIGPVTAREAERVGLRVVGVAEPYTAPALAELVVRALREEVAA